MKWFENVKKIEELRQLYRKLLKEHHPDNGGDEETMKEINLEYDRVFSDLSRFSSDSGQCTGEEMSRLAHKSVASNTAIKSSLLMADSPFLIQSTLSGFAVRFT